MDQPLSSPLRRSLQRQKTQRRHKRYNAPHFRHTQNCHFERSRPTLFLSPRSCARFASRKALRDERSACAVEKSLCDPRVSHRNLHCPLPFSLAPSKNAIMSFNSFSGRAFASYAGINDSRVFTYDRSLLFSNGCNCWRVSSICTVKLSSFSRSEEHTSELQSPCNLVCRLLLEKK